MKYLQIILFPYLLLKSFYYRYLAGTYNYPGKEFLKFGNQLGIKLLAKHQESLKLILTPVSIVRYFEYDFCAKSLFPIPKGSKILDVSSPYLFGFYASHSFDINYTYINPDIRDTNNVQTLAKALNFKGKYSASVQNALQLEYENNYFDHIVSISVIEHINNDGDMDAVKELWRVLKVGGKLVLTFPVKAQFFEEYRSSDVYELNADHVGGKYFFQRFYDEKAIQERLLNQIENFTIAGKKLFGEIENGFFEKYEKRWIADKHLETVKDPYYIATKFSYFNNINELPGLGVLGLTLLKN